MLKIRKTVDFYKMARKFSFFMSFFYCTGVILGIFTFKFGKNYETVVAKTYLKCYSLLLSVFLVFVGIPLSYVYYFQFIFDIIERDNLDRMIILVLNLHIAEMLIAYLALIKTLFFSKIKINDLMQEALILNRCLINFADFCPANSKYFRMTYIKILMVDISSTFLVLYDVHLMNAAEDTYRPKLFFVSFLLVLYLALTVAESFKNFAYLYAADFIETLNEKLRKIVMMNDLNVISKTEEILILHEKMTNFVLKLDKFSGLTTIVNLNCYFVGIISQVNSDSVNLEVYLKIYFKK